jgi:hypothetical protein
MKTLKIMALMAFTLFHGDALFAQQTIHFEENGVVISSVLADCSDPANGTANMLRLITVTNDNDYAVKVRFTKQMWYRERCIGCNESNPEQEVTVNLSAGASSSGVCGDRVSRLWVFHSMKDNASVQKLTRFDLTEVSVHSIKN